MDNILTLLGICVAVAVMGLGIFVIAEARQDAWSQASQASENLRLALGRDIARNLGAFDLSLRGVINALAEEGIDQASPGVRRQAMFDSSATAEDLGAILILDASGHIAEESTSLVPHSLDLSDRDYFVVHRDRPDIGLFVSRPYHSRLADGELRVGLSRRLSTPDGQFAGVVEGALRMTFFQRLFRQLDIGPKGTITLFRDDGRVLLRYPFREQDVDLDLSQSATFRRFALTDHGQFVSKASIDGVERLYTFGRVPGLPLILTVNRATEDILAPWWHRTLLTAPILFLLLLAAMTSSLLFRREIRRRTAIEGLLRKAASELQALATVDALTGIANRRAFDVTLDEAWRQAKRTRTSPIALVMIDVDYFKLFNDRLGHQEGDRVLRSIASCLDRTIGRPTDLCSRYGGEEFAAILPDTDLTGALHVAERMRSAIVDLNMAHPDSPHGRVTVSIGVATCRPNVGDLSSMLVREADAALYEAKNGGRNQVRAESQVHSAPVEVCAA